MGWQGHWHGYGWVGSGEEYRKEFLRRPGPPGDPSTAAFMTSRLPPMMTGHWLLKRAQTASDQTWGDVDEAIAWLRARYEDNPPYLRESGGRAGLPLVAKIEYARVTLPLGVDVVWGYWTHSQSMAHYAVICCPSRHHDIPCPMPPS
ncbi:hypothetical protein C7M71_014625 [Peterkaempfera bronchialis]|uniref:Uncharacterized protein n=1 Tax=Peterkaempfera bronchialis TaxID=2126346 RepID=A0A345SXM7_9ACTN|nr:hypothetical protein C7M71_014625 [Peterkaempfera bronchialis]